MAETGSQLSTRDADANRARVPTGAVVPYIDARGVAWREYGCSEPRGALRLQFQPFL